MLLLIAPIMRAPMPGETAADGAPPKVQQSGDQLPAEPRCCAPPAFWLLYVMFVLVSASGLMATAQIAPIAKDYGLTSQALLFGGSALAVALVVDNVMNGGARPFFGWVSDHIGREPTMAIAFALGGCAYLLLAFLRSGPVDIRNLRAALIFFTWGEIFSLFPVHLHRSVRHPASPLPTRACSIRRKARQPGWCRWRTY